MCQSIEIHAKSSPEAQSDTQTPDCVPRDEVCQRAYNLARESLPVTIVNHSIRVFLHTKSLAVREKSEWASKDKVPLLFVACMLHDLGCATQCDGPERFEVEGADAAAALLRDHKYSEPHTHEVWQAIALHTSPGIAERIAPLARLVRLGVTIDFKRKQALPFAAPGEIEIFEQQYPRLEIEKVLGDAVTEQSSRQPDKAPPASWAGVMLRSKRENPEWNGVNKAF